MVSDFIDEVNSYLQFEEEEYLEHQSEGYFTNDLFVDQVSRAVGISEKKYPGVIGLFIIMRQCTICMVNCILAFWKTVIAKCRRQSAVVPNRTDSGGNGRSSHSCTDFTTAKLDQTEIGCQKCMLIIE